jgi:hypothetical protein
MKRAILASALVLALASPAYAQMKFEASILGGYTFSEGLSGDVVVTPSGTFDSIDVKSGGAFGLNFGFVMASGGEIGFSWSRQMSELSVSGINTRVLGDMNIDSYHGYFAYNFMRESTVQPYVSIGFGATTYGAVPFTTAAGAGAEIPSTSRFSTTWGFGMKAWANDNFGFRAGMVWTPTYITSEADGWWCDPYWGCYIVGDSKYSNQFQINGGVTFRFGGN